MKRYLLLFSVLIGAATCLAQTDEPPVPPVSGVEVANTVPTPRYEDNVRPLSGVQNFDLGTPTERMNTFTPSFNFSEAYGTNPGLTYGPAGETVWGSTTNLGGSLQLMRGNIRNLFSMSYNGSAQLNSYNSELNTQVHSLALTQSITAGRWTYLIGDTLTYQPNAYGGYGALLFPGSNFGTPGSDFRPGVAPNDSILTSQNPQLNNTALGQFTYGISRTSSFTGSASYGILHYLDGGFFDTRQFNGTGGFDHRFGRNTLGVAYTYSKFMYDNVAQDFETNTVQLTYGRRIIGRVSINLGGGPTIRRTTFGSITSRDVDVSGQANINYAGSKSSLNVGYTRAVTGGSGVTPGALTDGVVATIDRSITRTLTANLSAGYSHNSAYVPGSDYNTVYFSGGISHMISRNVTVSIGYRGQRQNSNGPSADLTTQAVVASFMWHFHPIRLQ